MSVELIRIVDSISRDKNIEKESIFADLEAAMVSAARKAFPEAEDVEVKIDRVTGDIAAHADGEEVGMATLGRIAAQTAKQVLIQKIREDERDSIFEEYSQRVGTVVTGTVLRYEGSALIINLGRTEGIMPRGEQIPGESHHSGERIRAMIFDVREEQSQVRIVLTQTHPDYIRKLFELEVPEVGDRIIEVRALAREAGYRTKIAVSSIDSKVDAVGACVGVRGSRIRNIVDELGGEKIDIVRWNESSQVLIGNSLKPAEVKETFLCFELGRATVIVEEDQLSLAIGKRGQNVRLAARLTGWDIDISTPAEYDRNVDAMEKSLKQLEGVDDVMLDKLLAIGAISLADVAEVGVDPLVSELEVDPELAANIVEFAGVEAKRVAAEYEEAKKIAEAEKAAAAAEAERAVDEGTADTTDAADVEDSSDQEDATVTEDSADAGDSADKGEDSAEPVGTVAIEQSDAVSVNHDNDDSSPSANDVSGAGVTEDVAADVPEDTEVQPDDSEDTTEAGVAESGDPK